MNYENNISKMLKEKRIKLGMSIRDLAKLAKVSPTTICEVEKGNNTKHTFTTIAKIAKVLDLNLNNLINEIDTIEEISYAINIKKIDDNCIEIYSENKEIILKFLKDFSFESDYFLSEDNQEDLYYCPFCNEEL